MAQNDALTSLSRLLEYTFKNEVLLAEALTHRSAAAVNNERLEFLGDGILNFIIAARLFEQYADMDEGDLSRLRASLVNKDSLADIARTLELGQYIELGSGELKSGGRRRDSILAAARTRQKRQGGGHQVQPMWRRSVVCARLRAWRVGICG